MKFGNIFDQITNNTNLDKESIFNVADSIKNADLSDEKVIRKLIRDLSAMVGRPVPKQLEDSLVKRIKEDGVPSNLSDLF